MASATVFAPGMRVVVRDEEWLVQRSELLPSSRGWMVEVVGLSELVRHQKARFLTDLDRIQVLQPESAKLIIDRSPAFRQSRLYLESLLRHTPPTDSRLVLGHQGALDPAPYQLVPTHKALNALKPRILIADGVGLGKTAEVGILLTELIKRGRGERILVVAIKSILEQFQQELWARFNIPLVRLDSVGIQRVRSRIPANKNPFTYYRQVIVSVDTLKNDGQYRHFLEQCHWDVIVVDECHNVANANTQRNRLVSLLANRCDSLILTSATPHNGKPETFANLVNMLDPTAIADPADYTKEDVQHLFVRRFKKDIVGQAQQQFRDRVTLPALRAAASEAEEGVFELLAAFRQSVRNTPGQAEQLALGLDVPTSRRRQDDLFKVTLFKAFLSSPAACLETVERRRKGVEADSEDARSLDELARCLKRIDAGHFSKYHALKGELARIAWTGKANSGRILIFSERVRTLEWLRDHLKQDYGLPADAIALFHAGLPDTEQTRLVESFGKADSPIRVLLASDVASEGVNLHYYCHDLFHFDLPWSLITLEQRNGRIDRFGQTETPTIRYLMTTSREPAIAADQRVLDRLIQKEEAAYRNLGDVATLMGLYSAEDEEQRITEGLLAGEAAESIIPEQPEEEFDFLSLFSDEADAAAPAEDDPAAWTAIVPSLFPDDLAYARSALDELHDHDPALPLPEWRPGIRGFEYAAPEDLQRSMAMIPSEAIPPRWSFVLSADRDAVQQGMAEARKTSGEWPRVHLLWERHPLMQWLTDKVLCTFDRHEAPVVPTPNLQRGEVIYLFLGIVSNQRSQPVLAEWFGVRYRDWQAQGVLSLEDVLQATGFRQDLPNPGHPDERLEGLHAMLSEAVATAIGHMKGRREARRDDLQARLTSSLMRLKTWHAAASRKLTSREQADAAAGKTTPIHIQRRRDEERRQLQDILEQEDRWLKETMTTVKDPFIRLGAVFVGA